MNVSEYLRAPRVPKRSPVIVLHLCADHDRDANARAVFAVLTPRSQTVDVIPVGSAHGGEDLMRRRWPWFAHYMADAFGGIETAYDQRIEITPAEYRRWMRHAEDLDTETPELIKLRQLGDRCEGYSLLINALQGMRRASADHRGRERRAAAEGRENLYGDTRSSTVYHRTPEQGGTPADSYLRRALRALCVAGMAERTDTPPTADALMAERSVNDPGYTMERARRDARFFRDSVGQYRATDTTPDIY